MNNNAMRYFEQLSEGSYYHIYNRGINGCNLFTDPSCYQQFLHFYDRFISPIANTFAWVLMPNHFHLLIQVKENMVYRYTKENLKGYGGTMLTKQFEELKWDTIKSSHQSDERESLKSPVPHLHFGHLFNAYCKWYNLRFERHGSMFERPYKRKLIDREEYLNNVILYIHNNPVHHGFCNSVGEYPWSSFESCRSSKPTKLQRTEVIEWFGGEDGFEDRHNEPLEIDEMEKWLLGGMPPTPTGPADAVGLDGDGLTMVGR